MILPFSNLNIRSLFTIISRLLFPILILPIGNFSLSQLLILIYLFKVSLDYRPVIDVTLSQQECATIPPAIRSY